MSKPCRWNGRQCRPWSDCSSCRSSLIWVCTVCPDLFVWNLGPLRYFYFFSGLSSAKDILIDFLFIFFYIRKIDKSVFDSFVTHFWECRRLALWMDGWVQVYVPFNSISFISRWWKGEDETLCAVKPCLGSGRIFPPVGFKPATLWSEIWSANRSATGMLQLALCMKITFYSFVLVSTVNLKYIAIKFSVFSRFKEGKKQKRKKWKKNTHKDSYDLCHTQRFIWFMQTYWCKIVFHQ